MPREIITATDVPHSTFLSPDVRAGGHIYVSSMAGIDAGPGSLAGPAIQDQAGNAP